jgi:phosphosulfolactate synthase
MSSDIPAADFLDLPTRAQKPRDLGITHVFDKGVPTQGARGLVDAVGPLIDIWKFGFGTAYLDRHLGEKIALLEANQIKPCPGGTLLEVAWLQGEVDAFFDWAGAAGFNCVEVSNGATAMPTTAKRELIGRAADRGFEVFAEVGSKDPGEIASPDAWVEEVRGDVAAGASWVVAEGRESGTVGLYESDGTVRSDLVHALEEIGGSTRIVYEAPRRSQQAWLIRSLGANVNLGNIALDEVLSVEALRAGLRTDTVGYPVRAGGEVRGPCSS